MSQTPGRDSVRDLTPEEVARGLTEGRMLLIDVREPEETAVERYPDAFHLPMSAFNPGALPYSKSIKSTAGIPARRNGT